MSDTNPDGVIVLSNGTLKDPVTGRFLSPPDAAHAPITRDNARAIASKRWDAYREAAASAVASTHGSTVAGWQWLVGRQFSLAGDVEKGRASTEAARFVAQAIGAVPDRAGDNRQSGVDIHLSDDIVMQIAEFVTSAMETRRNTTQKVSENDTIEGDVIVGDVNGTYEKHTIPIAFDNTHA